MSKLIWAFWPKLALGCFDDDTNMFVLALFELHNVTKLCCLPTDNTPNTPFLSIGANQMFLQI